MGANWVRHGRRGIGFVGVAILVAVAARGARSESAPVRPSSAKRSVGRPSGAKEISAEAAGYRAEAIGEQGPASDSTTSPSQSIAARSIRPRSIATQSISPASIPVRTEATEEGAEVTPKRPRRGIGLLRFVRRTVGLVWITFFVACLVLGAAFHLAPYTGRTLFIIRGSSMSPAIPLGSLVAITRVDPTAVAPGDVLSVRTPSGLVITHRVRRVITAGDQPVFELKGDANPTADPVAVPASAIVGRLDVFVPYVGYALAVLSKPSGVLLLLSVLGALLVAYWLLEGVEEAYRPRGLGRAGAAPVAPPSRPATNEAAGADANARRAASPPTRAVLRVRHGRVMSIAIVAGIVGLSGGAVLPPSLALFSDAQSVPATLDTKAIFEAERVSTGFELTDASSGSESDASSNFASASDGLMATTAAWSPSFASDRYLDFDFNSPLPSDVSVTAASFHLDFSSSAGGASACYYIEVRRISTGAVIATYGDSSAPLLCVVGTTLTADTTSLPVVTTTNLANDLRVRVYGRDSGGNAMVVDRATVSGVTAYSSFTLYPVVYTDAADATPEVVHWGIAGP